MDAFINLKTSRSKKTKQMETTKEELTPLTLENRDFESGVCVYEKIATGVCIEQIPIRRQKTFVRTETTIQTTREYVRN